MKLIAKGIFLVAIVLVAIVAVPALTTIILHGKDEVIWPTGSQTEFAAASSLRLKDDSRVSAAAANEQDKASLLIQLAQASRAAAQTRQEEWLSQMTDILPPAPFAPAPMDPGAWPAPPVSMEPPAPPPITKVACEDAIHRAAAHAAFIKSKLRLQPQQRETWHKIEDAAQPSVDKLHAACDRLPVDPSAPPSLPDAIDAAEAQLSARVELLRAVREPVRALFETLSPEQRMALQPPLQPRGLKYPL